VRTVIVDARTNWKGYLKLAGVVRGRALLTNLRQPTTPNGKVNAANTPRDENL
jgi:hypothetical protein